MSAYRIYTLWASLKGEETAPWMIAAEDDSSWEGDPERCEEVFQRARDLAAKNGWDVREITLRLPFAALDAAFSPTEVEAAT